tara:strand:- start:1974 stop:2336 length:363 start_codon:yes stop_codon:yes gene_type:complete
MSLVVKNSTEAIHSIQLKEKILVLKPGNNEVTEKQWAEIKANHICNARITSGKYILIEPDAPADKKESKGEALSGYDAKTAIELVKGTFDLVLLTKWESEESRSTVLAAVRAQIKDTESK